MRAAAKTYKWNLNYGGIALMWRGGCIIRSVFLGKIKEAFDKNPNGRQPAARSVLQGHHGKAPGLLAARGIGHRGHRWASRCRPFSSAALAYFDGYRTGRLPANLLQAQRDYFGAHTYERVDKPRGEFFHTNWTGRGGARVTMMSASGWRGKGWMGSGASRWKSPTVSRRAASASRAGIRFCFNRRALR